MNILNSLTILIFLNKLLLAQELSSTASTVFQSGRYRPRVVRGRKLKGGNPRGKFSIKFLETGLIYQGGQRFIGNFLQVF